MLVTEPSKTYSPDWLIEKKYFDEWQKELEMYHSGGGKESLDYVTFLIQKK